jgi:hypothetical protein
MNTNFKKYTSFYPQTYGQTKVVNGTLINLLRGYNQKYPNTWDENFIYVQHSYNIVVHTSTGKSPFKTCFGYFPPFPLDVVYGQQGGVMDDIIVDALKEKKMLKILGRSIFKYKIY